MFIDSSRHIVCKRVSWEICNKKWRATIETGDCQCNARLNATFRFCLFSFFWFESFEIAFRYRMPDLNRFKFNLAVNFSIIIHLKLSIKRNSSRSFCHSIVISAPIKWYIYYKHCLICFHFIESTKTETIEQCMKSGQFDVSRWRDDEL